MKRIEIEEKLEALTAECLKKGANYGDLIFTLQQQMNAVQEAAEAAEAQRID